MYRIVTYIRVSAAYHFFVWSSILFPRSKKKNRLAGYCLISRPDGSFRLRQSEHKDPLIILKYGYRQLLKWLNTDKSWVQGEGNKSVALYDIAINSKPRLDFIESVDDVRPAYYLSKENLSYYKLPLLFKIVKSLFLLINILFLLPFTISKHRAKMGLMIFGIDECATLLWVLKELEIKKLYYSGIAEIDSNACSILVQKQGIKVIKNPSEDPMYFHNQIIIADELGICNPYQKTEVETYKDTMFVHKTKQWYPEMHLTHLKGKEWKPAEKDVLGYYSGSSWLRIALNYNLVSDAYDSYSAEAECEENIGAFIKANPQFKLRVFLHPLEKKHMDLTEAHFKKIWDGIAYEFEDIEKHSMQTFHRCSSAVTVFSGVMYYRFFAGYRGIMYCPNMPGFPIKSSLLDSVAAKNYEDLDLKIKEQLALTDNEFHSIIMRKEYSYA